jgi:YggT family protein
MMFLLQYNILHSLISLFFAALIILMFVRMILSWFRIGDGNPIMLFVVRCTEPFIVPIRKRVPPVAFLDISWFFAWSALIIMRILLLQALPPGW